MSFWKNLGKGDFEGAFHNLLGVLLQYLPPELGALVQRLTDDVGRIIWDAAKADLPLVLAGTKTKDEAAADILASLTEQGLSVALNDILDALGIQQRAKLLEKAA